MVKFQTNVAFPISELEQQINSLRDISKSKNTEFILRVMEGKNQIIRKHFWPIAHAMLNNLINSDISLNKEDVMVIGMVIKPPA